jgi:hypothetical protein
MKIPKSSKRWSIEREREREKSIEKKRKEKKSSKSPFLPLHHTIFKTLSKII